MSDANNPKHSSRWLGTGGLTLMIALTASCDDTTQADPDAGPSQVDAIAADTTAAETVDVAAQNSVAFHLVDFVGWNNRDWGVMRHLHTADVKVDMAGQHTEGIDAHIDVLVRAIENNPEARILQHTPIVAAGDWTCMVGVFPNGGTMATAARWRDGAIAEEYIYLGAQPAGTPRPVLAGDPLVDITNPQGASELYDLAGATPGWSCVVDRAPDGRRVAIFTEREAGTTVSELIYTEF